MSRILLVESDPLLAKNILKLLKKHKFRAEWQVDPQLALDSIDKRAPNLIIVDFLLARRSGVEFFYELRSYPEWQTIPMIVYSSVAAEELGLSLDTLEQLGVVGYLYKNHSSATELVNLIQQALQNQPNEAVHH